MKPGFFDTSSGHRPSARADAPKRILVFHIGSLGDTLVALPAFWAVHDTFADARRVLLTKAAARSSIPVGRDILDGSGLFDDYVSYDGDHHDYGSNPSRWRKLWGAAQLVRRLRAGRFDLAVYLAPSAREPAQIRRDLLFFRLAGIRHVIGARTLQTVVGDTGVLEAERVLARLRGSAVVAAPLSQARRDLALNAADRQFIEQWLGRHAPPLRGRGRWVAFAPGSNLQSKLWPLERFAEVGRELIARFDIVPVVVGGAEDQPRAVELLQAWGRGIDAAGALSVRQSAALLERCSLFIGNDTGTMHLAAAGGLPCVALFSARDVPGRWEPMGNGHQVLRKEVPCAGCMLVRCDERDRLCMKLISVDEVLRAATAALVAVPLSATA